jgi:hypothetical protein
MLGQVLITTFCDHVQFVNLYSKSESLSIRLPCSSPHLVSRETKEKDLLYTCQDTASNNLMVVNMEDLELQFGM